MKKIYYLLAAVLLASCANDEPEVPAVPAEPQVPVLNTGDSTALADIVVEMRGENGALDELPTECKVKIELDRENNEYRVSELELYGFESMRLPASIGGMSKLTKLVVDGGSLYGAFPTTFYECPVETLIVSNMKGDPMLGTTLMVPANLARFQSTMRRMEFRNCEFSGPIPQAVLEAYADAFLLQGMTFENCGLSGMITADYGKIRELNIEQNNFSSIDWEIFVDESYNVPYMNGNCLPGAPLYVKKTDRWKEYKSRYGEQRKRQ